MTRHEDDPGRWFSRLVHTRAPAVVLLIRVAVGCVFFVSNHLNRGIDARKVLR